MMLQRRKKTRWYKKLANGVEIGEVYVGGYKYVVSKHRYNAAFLDWTKKENLTWPLDLKTVNSWQSSTS